MAYVTTATLAVGVVLSIFSGLVCYAGAGALYSHLFWVPQADLVFANPQTAFGVGIMAIVASFLCRPSGFD